jgi:hypothetical protein
MKLVHVTDVPHLHLSICCQQYVVYILSVLLNSTTSLTPPPCLDLQLHQYVVSNESVTVMNWEQVVAAYLGLKLKLSTLFK